MYELKSIKIIFKAFYISKKNEISIDEKKVGGFC